MSIKKNIVLTLSIILIICTFAGCRKINGESSSNNFSSVSSSAYGIVDIVEDNSSDIQSIGDDGTVSENNTNSTSSNNSNSSTVNESIFTENVVSVGSENNNANPDAPLTYIEPDPEIPQDKGPYTTSPDSNGNVTTVDIQAGKSVYYKISRVSNKVLTINSSNAYVIYENTTYNAVNGVVSFMVETDNLANEQILFEIGNKSTKTESFTINFSSPKGTWDNKEKLSAIGEKITVSLKQGNDQGYNYTYKATQKGKIKFYILSDVNKGILEAYNTRSYSKRNTNIEDEVKIDSIGSYIVLDVEKDDTIYITAVSKSETLGDYPATTIQWQAIYE